MGEEHTVGSGYMDLGVQIVEVNSSLGLEHLVGLCRYWMEVATKALVSYHFPLLSAVVGYP